MVMLGRCIHFMGLYPTLGCHGTQNVLHKHNVLPFHMEIVVIHIMHQLFVSPAPQGARQVFNFSIFKALLKAWHCGSDLW